jgi:DNA-binding MarR family transcriptional regulator
MIEKAQALESLIGEVVSLFHHLRTVAEKLYGFKRLSGGKRGVLRDLYRNGTQTVPQLARSRPVSRQHIQTIVNPLAEEGLVEFRENPAHQRSKLVGLTEKGVELIEEMNRRELELLSGLKINASDEELNTAVAVLRSMGVALQSTRTAKLIEAIDERRKKR